MSIVEQAKAFAIGAHGNQTRKYTGEPYWHHLQEVAKTIYLLRGSYEMQAAAWLHDVIEDTLVDVRTLTAQFGSQVADMVVALTQGPYPREGMNRAARKAFDRERLSMATDDVQTIKLADLIDNTKDIVYNDAKFAQVYIKEKTLLLGVMTQGNQLLREYAIKQVVAAWTILGDSK